MRAWYVTAGYKTVFILLCIYTFIATNTAYVAIRTGSRLNFDAMKSIESTKDGNECEKTGSCRQVRGDFKKELNEQRLARIAAGNNPEIDYLEVLNGGQQNVNDKNGKKTYSPFRRNVKNNKD